MNITLNYCPNEDLNEIDMRWLNFIWEKSNGVNCLFNYHKVSKDLKETLIYTHIFERLDYYKDHEYLIDGYKISEDNNIYIVLNDAFYSTVNSISYKRYEGKYTLLKKEKGGTMYNIKNYGTISQSNLQFGSVNSNQNTNIDNSQKGEITCILDELINDLSKIKGNVDTEEVEYIIDDIKNAKNEMLKEKPDKIKFNKVLSNINKFILQYSAMVEGLSILSEHYNQYKTILVAFIEKFR